MNASPAISLVKIGVLDLCLPIFEDIIIPKAVEEEIIAGKDEATKWIKQKIYLWKRIY